LANSAETAKSGQDGSRRVFKSGLFDRIFDTFANENDSQVHLQQASKAAKLVACSHSNSQSLFFSPKLYWLPRYSQFAAAFGGSLALWLLFAG
jgi:hypothetical protein